MKLIGRGFIRWVAVLLYASGLLGFFGTAACGIFSKSVPGWLELPLGDVGALAVGGGGRVYCSSQGYGRIQMYREDGRFLRGWSSPYKAPSLIVDQADCLHVVSRLGDAEETVYSSSGQFLRRVTLPQAAYTDTANPRLSLRLSSGLTYEVRSPNLWPRVVRITQSGEVTTVVNMSLGMWFLAGPLPAWLRLIAGLLILNLLRQQPVKREADGSRDSV